MHTAQCFQTEFKIVDIYFMGCSSVCCGNIGSRIRRECTREMLLWDQNSVQCKQNWSVYIAHPRTGGWLEQCLTPLRKFYKKDSIEFQVSGKSMNLNGHSAGKHCRKAGIGHLSPAVL